MKKFNLIAVAFTAILSQSATADSTIWSHIIGAKAGTENKNIVWQNTDHDNGVSFKNGETAIFYRSGNNGEDKNTAVLPGDERKILRNCPPAERGLGFHNTYGMAMHQEKVVIFKSIFTKNDERIKCGAETAFWSNDSKKIYRNMLPEENGRREQIYTDYSFGF
ncbi:MAG: hypothetical protein SOX94_10670 [Prevotella sp.]|nr:hypothetical protein [Prevotella sp.]